MEMESKFDIGAVTKSLLITNLLNEKKNNYIKAADVKIIKYNLSCDHANAELETLNENVKLLQMKIERIKVDIVSTHEKNEKYKEINEELEEILQKKNELEQKFSELQYMIVEDEKKFLSDKSTNQVLVEKANTRLELLRKNLGVSLLRTTTGSLYLTFTQINRVQPTKEYIIEMSVQGDTYKLHRTVPPINNLKEIEDNLNDTDNFLGFLIYMRSLFVNTDT